MIELVASKVVDGQERHFVLVEEAYSPGDEPFTLFVNAAHFSVERHEIERAFFHTLVEGQAYCREHHGISLDAWRPADEIRFRHELRFEYGVTNLGVPQPYPVGFERAEVVFRLGKVEHPDESSTPVLDISGNREGLRWLAAQLLLCAEGERYDPSFHVHLERNDAVEILSDIDVTLRSPSYHERLRRGPLRQWSTTKRLGDDGEPQE